MKIQKYDFNIWTPYLLRNGSKLNHQSSVNSINIRPLLISNIMEWNSYVDIQQANSKCSWNYFLPWEIVTKSTNSMIQHDVFTSFACPRVEWRSLSSPSAKSVKIFVKTWRSLPRPTTESCKKINSITQRPKMIYDVFVKLRKE